MSHVERIEAEMLSRKQWLESLDVGSEVALRRSGQIGIVAGVEHPILFVSVKSCKRRFSAQTGHEVGNYHTMIEPVTEEFRQEVKAKANRERIRADAYRNNALTDGEIAVMLDALDAYRARQPKAAPGGEP